MIPPFLGIAADKYKVRFYEGSRNSCAIDKPVKSMLHAKDIMTSPAYMVNEDTPIFEIASIFAEKDINRVPVIDKNDHLVGIVARADIFQATCTL